MHFTAKINMRTIVQQHGMRNPPQFVNEQDKLAYERASLTKIICIATLHGYTKQDVEDAARIWLRNNSWFWKPAEVYGGSAFFDMIQIDVTFRERVRITDMLDRERI